jgi:peptide/nickel transport system substrate-binding protein
MWTRIGVRTTVEAQTWATFVSRAGRAEYSAHLIGWGSNPDGSHPMRNIIATVSASAAGAPRTAAATPTPASTR